MNAAARRPSFVPEARAILALLDEVARLDTRFQSDLMTSKSDTRLPATSRSKFERSLDAIEAKLVEAERRAATLKDLQADRQFADAASRVSRVAAQLAGKP